MLVKICERVYQQIIIYYYQIYSKKGGEKCRKCTNKKQMLKESLKLQGEKEKERKEVREKNIR